MRLRLNFVALPLVLALVACNDSNPSPAGASPTEDGFLTPDGSTVDVQIAGSGSPVMQLHDGGRGRGRGRGHDHHHDRDDDDSREKAVNGGNEIIVQRGTLESTDEVKACADALKIDAKQVAVVGGRSRLTMNSSQALFVKLVGTRSKVSINIIPNAEKSPIEGVCVITHGGHNTVALNVNTALKNMLIKGSGHENTTRLEIGADGDVQAGQISLDGKGNKVIVSGTGKIDCAKVTTSIRGTTGVLECAAPAPAPAPSASAAPAPTTGTAQ